MNQGLICKFCRFGKKRQPTFRLGVLPKYRSPNKKFALDFIGFYNPISKEFKVDEAKLKDYLSRGMALTKSVNSILIKHGILPKDPEKVKKEKITTKKTAKKVTTAK